MASSGHRSSGGRAAVSNEIIINASAGETRVALVEQGTFTELHIERERDRNVAGMVALGRVTRVLPGMQAAFVDIGLEKAAFLYVGDYLDGNGQLDGADDDPRPRRGRRGQRQIPRIETLLEEGQEIVVQIAKEPIGTKGARITSHLSIAGRHLVLTPWSKRVGVSRRIGSDRERRRLRDIVQKSRPKDLGFIIRTAGEGTREADIEADVKYLSAVWEEIQRARKSAKAPALLYEELSLPLRTIRDFANSKTKRIVVDDPPTHEKMQAFLDQFVADPRPNLELYEGDLPLYDHEGLESRIDENLGRKVWLKSGGYLIVDQSEALTAIDVNTGRYVGKRDLEETVLKTNLEAVQEVVYQLRFRNLGGLIIIDLIDMESAENREKVYRALQEALRYDKARTNILKISELGLVEMTRKRTRENLVQQLCEPCSFCEGRGYVLSAETVAYKLLREIRKDLPRFSGTEIQVAVNPRVAEMFSGPAHRALQALSTQLGREIHIQSRTGLHQEQFEVIAVDQGPAVKIPIRWLESREERAAAEAKAAEDARRAKEEAAAKAKAEEEARAAEEAARAQAEAEAKAAKEAARAAKRAEAEAARREASPGADASEATPETAAVPPAPLAAGGVAMALAEAGAEDDLEEPKPEPTAADGSEAEGAGPEAPEPAPPEPSAAEAVDGPAEDPILRGLQNSEEV
ncbi:MAG: Rne/Rng family ribonuclease [Myxococcota bacterium]